MRQSRRKKRQKPEGVPDYMTTYGDVVTLLLTFFILLISAAKIEGKPIQLILANFPGLGNLIGGSTFVKSPLPESGYVIEALPSDDGKVSLDKLYRQAQAIFAPEVQTDQARVTLDERGLVISLASDFYFEKYSAKINVEENGEQLRNVSLLLRKFLEQNPDTPYRVEGHTDETSMPIGSRFNDEWDLSSARASALLRYMHQFLVSEKNAQVTGFGNTKPMYESGSISNAFNRRVDIVILNEGNL